MDGDEFRRIRTEAISGMYELLEETERVNLPHWVLMSLMLPMFMGLALTMSLRMLWALVKGWLQSPFLLFPIWADLIGIIWWFLRSMVKRMERK